MKRLLTFDLDNTLWHVDEVIRRATKVQFQWLAQHYPKILEQNTEKDFLNFRNQIIANNPNIIADLTSLRKQTMVMAAIAAGISKPEAQALAEQCFKVFFEERNKVVLFPDAHETLAKLSKDYTLIALSNGNADLEVIGIKTYFTAHFKPTDAGAAKPHPAMFELALKTAQCKASDSIHIGDDLVCDIEAAKNLGFITIFANTLKKHSPESEQLADASIQALHELPCVIEGLLSA